MSEAGYECFLPVWFQIIFTIGIVIAIAYLVNSIPVNYHEECIESHIEYTFSYQNKCIWKTLYMDGTTNCDKQGFEKQLESKVVCDKYALVRNATIGGQ